MGSPSVSNHKLLLSLFGLAKKIPTSATSSQAHQYPSTGSFLNLQLTTYMTEVANKFVHLVVALISHEQLEQSTVVSFTEDCALGKYKIKDNTNLFNIEITRCMTV